MGKYLQSIQDVFAVCLRLYCPIDHAINDHASLKSNHKKNRTKSEIFLEALRTQLCIFAVIKALSYPFLLGLWLFKTV